MSRRPLPAPVGRVVDRVLPSVDVVAVAVDQLARLHAPVVLAANHASQLDAALVQRAVPRHLAPSPLPASVALRLGRSVLVFPERGISPDATLGEFHDDATRLAAAHRLPVVPVAIRGSFGLDTEPTRWRNQPAPRVSVRFGVPLDAPSPDQLRTAIAELLREDAGTWWQAVSDPRDQGAAAGWLSAWQQLDPAGRPGSGRRPRIWN